MLNAVSFASVFGKMWSFTCAGDVQLTHYPVSMALKSRALHICIVWHTERGCLRQCSRSCCEREVPLLEQIPTFKDIFLFVPLGLKTICINMDFVLWAWICLFELVANLMTKVLSHCFLWLPYIFPCGVSLCNHFNMGLSIG